LADPKEGPVETMDRYLATTCAWCRRMQRPNGEWIEVSALVARSLRAPAEYVAVTHGLCPSCAREAFGTE
jgi:hypothetical protein